MTHRYSRVNLKRDWGMRSSHSMVSICQKMIRFNPTVTMPMNRKDKKILRRREVSSFSPKRIEKTAPLPMDSPSMMEVRKVISV